jgi:competence protein ComEC
MLKVHFLNVGHGDATLIEHPSGHLTLIDINNSQDPDKETVEEYAQDRGGTLGSGLVLDEARADAVKDLTDPIEYIKTHYPDKSLFRFILTHPDLDHMRGIKRLHEEIGFTNFWDIAHTKPNPEFWSDADKEDWNHYQSLRDGELNLKPKRYHRGDRHFAFGCDEAGNGTGDAIQLLSPTKELVNWCNQNEKSNDLSYALRVTHCGTSILLPGDAEETAWDEMLKFYGKGLGAAVLKAAHHGRDSGFHLEALKAINPSTVVVSVGKKPSTDASPKYRAHAKSVFSTRYYGNLRLEVDDEGTPNWFAERNGG